MRYFIQLSFDGTRYHGWQIQKNAHSVQAELNSALERILGQAIETTGCGRTDTGVHAHEFYVHFDSEKQSLMTADLSHQLNCILPHDIAIYTIFEMHPEAHARYDAISRTYIYHIHHQKDPFQNQFSAFYPHSLDLGKMNEFSSMLFDYSDFSCFSKTGTQNLTNICKISKAKWQNENGNSVFTVTADRFLRNMVRAIVGTLLEAGRGRLTEAGFRKILESKDRKEAGFSVPAKGLSLAEVKYPYL
ncbi:MAG TPA: tRNA pseudouridine(38-40) synthase TruA [Bacteroidia bacterium]|nr:tRNA pseudouridine(38-40) synthase TruA [Bacteroidia bacterium]